MSDDALFVVGESRSLVGALKGALADSPAPPPLTPPPPRAAPRILEQAQPLLTNTTTQPNVNGRAQHGKENP